jgi:hypothetical protein
MIVAPKLEKNPSGDKDNMLVFSARGASIFRARNVGAAWHTLRRWEEVG